MKKTELKTLESIKFIRLKYTNEDIIAFTYQEDHPEMEGVALKYFFLDPAKLTYVPSLVTGQMALVFSEWLSNKISPNEVFELWADDVLLITEVKLDMKESYLKFLEKILEFQAINEDFKPEPSDAITYEQNKNVDVSIKDIPHGQGVRKSGLTDDDIQKKILDGFYIRGKKDSIN